MCDKIGLYKEYHQDPDAYPGISILPHTKAIGKLIKKTGSKTVLDFGCGKGTQYTEKKIHELWGVPFPTLYDPAVEGFIEWPWKGFFDLVICTDVMEHVPEEETDAVFWEIFSLAEKAVFISICTRPAKAVLPNGENAHCTVESPQWWIATIEPLLPGRLVIQIAFEKGRTHTFKDGRKS